MRERKGILIAPLKLPQRSSTPDFIRRKFSTYFGERIVGWWYKFCGTGGKPTLLR
jgi:hypothetical protein